MTNYDIYKLVRTILRKDDKGYSNFLSNFSKLLQQANLDHFKEKYNAYQLNQDVTDSMSPFEVRQAVSGLTATATTITVPTDYAHFLGMYWTDDNGYDRVFDLVTDDEWDMRCGSALTVPTEKYPICKIIDDKLYVKPDYSVFDDWFLPSIDELDAMRTELHDYGLGSFITGAGVYYFSSTESLSSPATFASSLLFTGATIHNVNKADVQHVRACRKFTDSIGAYNLRDVGPSGGLIFYIDGTTYYEAAPSDQSENQAWSNVTNLAIGTTGTAIGTGQANTIEIINQAGHTDSAAKLCDDLIVE